MNGLGRREVAKWQSGKVAKWQSGKVVKNKSIEKIFSAYVVMDIGGATISLARDQLQPCRLIDQSV
jgi:hypothetical protein